MENSSSKKFVTIIYILLAITCYIESSSAIGHNSGKTSTEFIRSSCGITMYPTLCISSLSSHASAIQKSPFLLASTALSVTLATAKSTTRTMLKLSQSHGLKPIEIEAMRDCVEEMTDSVHELQKSIGEMSNLNSSNFRLMMSDIQTWVSAALTDEDTCTEGFAEKAMNGNVKNVVRARILNIMHLTSNALAFINNYASIHG